MEAATQSRGVSDGFLFNILFAMRKLGTILQTVDYKPVTCVDEVYYIDGQPVDKQEAIRAIEYFYQCQPECIQEDEDYLSERIFRYRQEN